MNILIVGIALFVCSIFLLYRNQYVFNIRSDIREAIADYNLDQILHGNYKENKIPYDCMEDYFRTLFRLFDFSNKNIVTNEIYKKIEKYI